MILTLREFSCAATCKLVMPGMAGKFLGSAPSNLRVRIALSPNDTVSRSNAAVKVAAAAKAETADNAKKNTAKAGPSLDRLRFVRLDLFSKTHLRIANAIMDNSSGILFAYFCSVRPAAKPQVFSAKIRFASSSVSFEPMSNQIPGTFQV